MRTLSRSCPDPRSTSRSTEAVRSTPAPGPPLSDPPKTTPVGFPAARHGPLHPPKLAGPFCDTTVIVLLPARRNGVRLKVVRAGRPAAEAAAFVMLPICPAETPLTRTSAKSSAAIEIVPCGAVPSVKVREKAKRKRSTCVLDVRPGPEIHTLPGTLER